jgi:hypothetical protein
VKSKAVSLGGLFAGIRMACCLALLPSVLYESAVAMLSSGKGKKGRSGSPLLLKA